MPLLTTVIFATVTGAGSTVGIAEKVYIFGAAFALGCVVQSLYWLITARIFASNIEKFQGCLTVSHIMHKLYGDPGRWVTSIFSLIISAGVIAAQAMAIGYVFHYFFGINVNYGIFISYGILTIYSALGGIRSVVFTEIFQFVVFFVIIPVSCALFFVKSGNMQNVLTTLPETHTALELNGSNLLLMAGLFLYVLIPNCDSPTIQRFLMASSSAELKKSLTFVAVISVPFTISLCFIAYAVKATAPNINPTEALFYFTGQLPIGFKGLMIMGLLAIFMSTAESWINSSAVIAANDIFKPLMPNLNSGQLLILARAFTVVISFASIFIATMGKGVVELIWFLDSFWIPLILIPLSTGFLGFQTTSKTFIANTVVALLFCFIGRTIAGEFGTFSLFTGLIGSTIGFFGMHCLQLYKGVALSRLGLRLPRFGNPFNNFSAKVANFQEEVWLEKPRVAVFGAFVLNYYFFFCFMLSSSMTNHLLILLMVIGFILSGPFLMRDIFFGQKFQKKYFAFYWYGLLTYCLPFIGSYCLLASNASTAMTVTGIVFTTGVLFFAPVVSSMVMVVIGSLLGYAVFALSHMHFGIATTIPFATMGYIYFLLAIIAVLFLRHQEKAQAEKIEAMQALAGTIAHEVKGPISAMSMVMETLKDILGNAIKTARKKNGSYTFNIDELDYEMMLSLHGSTEKLCVKSVHTVDSMLLMLKTSLEHCNKDRVFLSDLIGQALRNYEIHNSAVKNVSVTIDRDFELSCNELHLHHVLYNLLKNSYKYNGNDVKIEIGVKDNILYFTDYGNGISEDVLPYIFDRFYTKGTGGTGLGLAFCKLVMESIKGTITCQSKPGRFTQFKLTFNPNHALQV